MATQHISTKLTRKMVRMGRRTKPARRINKGARQS